MDNSNGFAATSVDALVNILEQGSFKPGARVQFSGIPVVVRQHPRQILFALSHCRAMGTS